jgi:hypothetical protein
MSLTELKTAFKNANDHITAICRDMLTETNPTKLMVLNTMKQYYLGFKTGLEFASQFLWEIT